MEGCQGIAGAVRPCLKKYLKSCDSAFPIKNIHSLIMDEVEKTLISEVLTYANGNQVKTAEILGISRATLRKKIELFQINQSDGLDK